MEPNWNPFDRPAEPPGEHDTDWTGWAALVAVLLLALVPVAIDQLLH